MEKNKNPIGILDSGVGGLTVAKEIIKLLPHENIIYLGDTARVPYGTRSGEVITQFALELVQFLVKKKVKCIVVACNTISATSLPAIRRKSPVPIIDVIAPTIEYLKTLNKKDKVGAIGTRGTIASGAYNSVASYSVACPLFVPLAEEGMTSGLAVEEIASGYLSGLKKATKIDTLILGCTHFPLLRSVIAKTMGNKVKLVESGVPTAKHLQDFLQKQGILRKTDPPVGGPKYQFFFTDTSERVAKIAENLLEGELPGKIFIANLNNIRFQE